MKFNSGTLNSAPINGEWHVGQASAEIVEGPDALTSVVAVAIAVNAACVEAPDSLSASAQLEPDILEPFVIAASSRSRRREREEDEALLLALM